MKTLRNRAFRYIRLLVALKIVIYSALNVAASGNVMGVDLGLSYVKVAVARPGRGLELVTNEQAKRKTPAAVGFTVEGERLFGDAAVAFAAKAPHRVILDGRQLIGQCDVDESSDKNGSPLCPHRRLKVDDVGDFSGEEVVAMILAMARRQASAYLGGSTIKDVAVTVPSWYDERQRIAIFDAARIIGLNCLGVVNSNTAAAIKYALDGKAKPTDEMINAEKSKDKKKRQPKSVTQRVLFYDVGAGGVTASVAEITSDVKTGIASNIRMLSHASDTSVGGRLLDNIIIDKLAKAFDDQRGKGATPSRDIPRVMTRLRKEAQRAREVLSANTETHVSVGSLYDDIDLRTTLTRADFEAEAEGMFALVRTPAKAALNMAGIKPADLDAVVPFGGASRTPRVQEELTKALDIASLNKSINTDEAAVFGSVFFGASMSSTFRVRKMDVEDLYPRSVSVEIDREGGGGLFSASGKKGFQTVEVFPEGGSKMPSKKTVSLNRKGDLSMRIYLNVDKSGNARFSERTLYAKVEVKGVAEVLKKMNDKKKAKSVTPRVAISFHIDRSGLITIGTAESSLDETVVVEREVEVKEEKKKNKTDGDGSTGDDGASDSKESAEPKDGADEKSGADDTETLGASPEKNAQDEKANTKKEKKTRIEKSTQTVVHRHTLSVEFLPGEGVLGMHLSGKELENAQKVLKNLEVADKERVERADALNALEGYVLEIRSLLRSVEEEDDLYKVSTEAERESITNAFDEAEDWMYTDDAKQTSNLRKKHFELRKLYAPVELRAKELSARPKMAEALRESLNMSLTHVASLREAHVSANSKHVAEFDKFPGYCADLLKWLDEKEALQASKPLTDEPAFTSDDVKSKGKELAVELQRMMKLEIPAAPKVVEGKDENKKEESSSSRAEDESGSDESNGNATESEVDGGGPGSVDGAEVPSDLGADSAKTDAGGAGSSGKDEL